MLSVAEHYAKHLGPVYAWMASGIESAIKRGAGELNDLGLKVSAGSVAVAPGAGFGMHAIAPSVIPTAGEAGVEESRRF